MVKKQVLQLTVSGQSGDSKRFILEKGSITAGWKKKNDVIITCPLKRFPLLKKASTGYQLFIPKEMTGTVYPDQGKSVSLESLRQLQLLPPKKRGHILTLPPGAWTALSYQDLQLKLEYITAESLPLPTPKEPDLPHRKYQGFIDKDQKDFWITVILSFLIHGIFFTCCLSMTIPPQKQSSLSAVPERFVKLIVKPKSMNPFEERHIERIQDRIKKALKEAKVNQKVAREYASSQESTPGQKEPPAPRKRNQPGKLSEKEKVSQPKKTTSRAAEVSGEQVQKKTEKQSSEASSGTQLASLNALQKDSGGRQQEKFDLTSIGILGMISSRESSQSPATIDPQLGLLAENITRQAGETILKQIEQVNPDSPGFSEFHEALLLEEELSGLPGGKVKTGLTQEIENQVTKNQETDAVEFQGGIAFQKIIDIKTSGLKSKHRTSEAILQVASSYKSSITYCYNKALKQFLNLKGRIVVEFTITADGTVSQAEIISSTMNNTDSGLEECVLHMIRNWRFTQIPEGVTTVVYPFVFFPVL